MCAFARPSSRPPPDASRRSAVMAIAEKISGGVSRRALLTGGLAGGFLLAFHLPVRAVNEPVQPPDDTDRQVRAQRLHPHRSGRPDHAGDAAGRDGAGRLHRVADDPGRRTRRRFCAGDARACAAERQALRQSAFWHSGHRQFQFGSGMVEAVAHGRRQRARHAGAGRRAAMAGRSCKLHDGQQRGHARRRAGAGFPMARWRLRRAARRRQRTFRSRTRRISC